MEPNLMKAVCRCRKVFFEDIENAVKEGATSFEEVQKITKVGQGCGICLKRAREITNYVLSQQK